MFFTSHLSQGGVLGGGIGSSASRGSSQGGREGTRPRTTGAEQSSDAITGTAPSQMATVGSSGAVQDDKQKTGEAGIEARNEDEVKAKEPGAVGMTEEVKMITEDMTGLSEEEIKKRTRHAKRMAEQLAMKKVAAEAAFKRDADERKRDVERKKKYAEEKRLKEEEEKKEEERKAEERKAEEEARKRAAAEQQATNGGQPTSGSAPAVGITQVEGSTEAEGGTGRDDETPRYLARLLSELITGVADPAGPHRPSNPAEESEASGSRVTAPGQATESKSDEAVSGDKSSGGGATEASGTTKEGEGGGGGGEPPRRSFAERYAGPEGTTVTISAAPSAPFGLPMEGPSLSIKNPGAGAEPEVRDEGDY